MIQYKAFEDSEGYRYLKDIDKIIDDSKEHGFVSGCSQDDTELIIRALRKIKEIGVKNCSISTFDTRIYIGVQQKYNKNLLEKLEKQGWTRKRRRIVSYKRNKGDKRIVIGSDGCAVCLTSESLNQIYDYYRFYIIEFYMEKCEFDRWD